VVHAQRRMRALEGEVRWFTRRHAHVRWAIAEGEVGWLTPRDACVLRWAIAQKTKWRCGRQKGSCFDSTCDGRGSMSVRQVRQKADDGTGPSQGNRHGWGQGASLGRRRTHVSPAAILSADMCDRADNGTSSTSVARESMAA
jgi:hypothetical protein